MILGGFYYALGPPLSPMNIRELASIRKKINLRAMLLSRLATSDENVPYYLEPKVLLFLSQISI